MQRININNKIVEIPDLSVVSESLTRMDSPKYKLYATLIDRSKSLRQNLKDAGYETVPMSCLYFTETSIYFWGREITRRSVPRFDGPVGYINSCLFELFPQDTTLEDIRKKISDYIPKLDLNHIYLSPRGNEIQVTVYYTEE